MSDKNLTELEWKKFSKGKGYKDTPFAKALAALELGRTPEAKLAALDDIEKQADVLRKANKADKELDSYLDGTEKAAGKERKLVEAEAKKAAAQQSASEDEDDSPALLTTKMIPLIRQVKKGEVMKTMVAIAGKDVAVMISRKPIGPPRRKLLSEYLGVSGGVRYAIGEVIWEENANTFVLQTQAGGLAKKIKAALYKQIELRLKVRVRGEDPADIDDDGEPAPEDEGGESEGTDEGAKAQQQQQSSTIPEAPPLAPTGEAPPRQETAPLGDEALAFNTRLAGLMPKVKATITAAGPNATDVKLKVSEAGVFARKREFAQANALLDEAERLIAASPQQGESRESEGEENVKEDGGPAFNARLAALMPKVKEALVAAGPNAAELKQKVSEAGVLARTKDFAQANALLDQAEQLLKPQQQQPGTDPRAAYDELRAQLEPLFLEATAATGTPPALADQVKAISTAWAMADESAGNEDFARAVLILKRLADGGALTRLLDARKAAGTQQPGGTAKAGPGLVQQRKFMLERWARIPAELDVELKEMGKILAAEGGDDNPKELVDAIDTHLQQLLSDIQDKLDAAINAGDTAGLKGLRGMVEQDGVMAHLLKAPFMDGSKFKSAVLDAMDEIEAGLTA